MNGVIIGRFMPPHNGHLYLIDFARHMVDRLYILVCTLSHEPIPGDLRYRWVRELAPTCETIHITEEIPEARRGASGATAIWARTVRDAVPAEISHVFASEDYGWDLAAELDARFVPVDPSRSNIPVSATQIRRDPYANWRFIPSVVRPYFVRHVAVVGDSKTTQRLADELDTVVVHSYRAFWRSMWSARYGDATTATATAESHDQRARDALSAEANAPESLVRRGITATATALARHANRILFYDLAEPRNLSEIGNVDAIVTRADARADCGALVPERPIFDIETVTAADLTEQLLPTPDQT